MYLLPIDSGDADWQYAEKSLSYLNLTGLYPRIMFLECAITILLLLVSVSPAANVTKVTSPSLNPMNSLFCP